MPEKIMYKVDTGFFFNEGIVSNEVPRELHDTFESAKKEYDDIDIDFDETKDYKLILEVEVDGDTNEVIDTLGIIKIEKKTPKPSKSDAATEVIGDLLKKVNNKQEFLVVYEDLWNNKESIRTTRIGDAIKEFMDAYDLISEDEIDFEKYNSDDPYHIGTTGPGFYDLEFYERDGEELGDYGGRIMIFTL